MGWTQLGKCKLNTIMNRFRRAGFGAESTDEISEDVNEDDWRGFASHQSVFEEHIATNYDCKDTNWKQAAVHPQVQRRELKRFC